MLYGKILAAIAGFTALASAWTVSAKEADFFRGKTVTVMVPSSLGTTLGLYGRLAISRSAWRVATGPSSSPGRSRWACSC